MTHFTEIIAKGMSVLLYPLFVPTYGIALFCIAYAQQVTLMPAVWWITAVAGTFILTCLLPMSAIWWLIRRGGAKDIQLEEASQRTVPYLYTVVGFGFWSYFVISILHAPLYIGLIAIGATIAIGIVSIINRRWKISAHLTGFGGLVGGILCFYYGNGMLPGAGTICVLAALSLLLLYARLYLHAHTSAQVCAGWLLGITCTFVPYYLLVAYVS